MTTGRYRHALVAIAALLCCAAASPHASPVYFHAKAVPNLRVTVVGARNLHHEDGLLGKNDPYAVVSVGAQRHRTKTVREAGSDVTWNETFTFTAQSTESDLDLQLMDDDLLKDDRIGRARIPVRDILIGETRESWYQVGEGSKARGEVLLKITGEP
ncbi:C2 domain-containing protein [Streptomyces sp. NPDC059355]|uniref:C2 domain-containing protein n=1 Tax=Streptomyces sp. NPDC059355 TaxID=3346811 RepID=UPI00369E242A